MVDLATAVGVVVIGRNEGARLIACLCSTSALGLPVVYVDSDSTDGSQAVAHAAGARVLNLDLMRPFTAARARLEGAEALFVANPKLTYVQFVDGDCTLAPAWIPAAHRFLEENQGYAVACGRRRERSPGSSPYNAMADLEWDTQVGDADACGGDALFRIAAYRAVGGFDAALIAGEEPELCTRLRGAGWQIRRLDIEMTVHDAAMTRLSQWWNRAVRSGFGYAQAWQATRMGKHALYRRELLRASVWTLSPVALSIVAGLAIHPAAWLIAPLVYAAQIARLAMKFGATHVFSWQRAGLLTLGKAAEAWGALVYFKRCAAGAIGDTISYK